LTVYLYDTAPPETHDRRIGGFEDVHATVAISPDGKPVVNLVMRASNTAGVGRGQAGSSTKKGDVNTNISELPLNGRSASDVAALEPGVATARTQASGQAQRGFGTEMTISGGRPRQNDSRLDGISVNDYSNGPPGSALGVNLGVDAVEQFSVLTSNYPAQHGRSSGGIIAASTRSGTSEFHGHLKESLPYWQRPRGSCAGRAAHFGPFSGTRPSSSAASDGRISVSS